MKSSFVVAMVLGVILVQSQGKFVYVMKITFPYSQSMSSDPVASGLIYS